MNVSFRQQQLKKEQRIKLAAFISLLGLGFIVLVKVDNLLLSFVLAFVISYLFGPIVNFLERKNLSRQISVLLLFFTSSAVMAIIISVVSPLIADQLNSLRMDSPRYIEGTTKLIRTFEAHFSFLSDIFSDFNPSFQVKVFLTRSASGLFEDIPQILSKSLTTAMLAPFFAFFMLRDGQALSHNILRMVPNRYFELFLNLQHQINRQLGDFIRARLFEAGIVGLTVWVGLWIIGFPYAPLLAVFASLTNLIPYVGPVIGAVPALIIALINGASFLSILLVLSAYTIAQIIDIFIIIPMVVARIVDLHPITVVIVIIIGAQIMGVLGMIVAIPVTSALKVTLSSVYEHLIEFRS